MDSRVASGGLCLINPSQKLSPFRHKIFEIRQIQGTSELRLVFNNQQTPTRFVLALRWILMIVADMFFWCPLGANVQERPRGPYYVNERRNLAVLNGVGVDGVGVIFPFFYAFFRFFYAFFSLFFVFLRFSLLL